MAAALALAARGLGNVWPNPAVGCVLVRPDLDGGRIVGRGWTQPGGRPHAETEALRRAGHLARGATAYVTLEPCCHTGQTGPCSDALIQAGVTRVVVALEDPDPRVAGGGIAQLRAAGITVEVGLLADAAAVVNAGFLTRVRHGRPLVTLKSAASLDGRIATAGGASKWITGPLARDRGHLLRAQHDAILVGAGTARADDPELTCRLPGLTHRTPVRVVMSSSGQVRDDGRLVQTASLDHPLWVIAGKPRADLAFWEQMKAKPGLRFLTVEVDASGRPDPALVLAALAAEGITRLLVEGGGAVAASFLKAGLVDRLVWFHAPVILGGDGLPAVAVLGLDGMGQAPRFRRLSLQVLGPDLLEILAVQPATE